MRKQVFMLVMGLLLSVVTVNAQNIQLHYDFGNNVYDELSDRAKITTTVEMFRPDKWGSTFFFVDMDYADNAVASAYWEIARELKFWEAPVSAHLEYNGGLNYIKNSYLAGATYSYNNKDFSKGFTVSALYKYICGNESKNNFQLTGTWYVNFGKGKFSFSGFADFWREKHTDRDGNKHEFTFITEPQLWFNLNALECVDNDFNLSVGTEWEISSNFALNKGWYWNPTVALKWTFK